jgi:hypothetical protein
VQTLSAQLANIDKTTKFAENFGAKKLGPSVD